MNLTIGSLVYSTAGHDKGNLFVIISEAGEYVYLADGKYRTVKKPKKKNKKHVKPVDREGYSLELIKENAVAADEEIKYFIKRFKRENQ
jgi:ribosomal protein L14E/L6E/L27E